jgi:hypothetical protein
VLLGGMTRIFRTDSVTWNGISFGGTTPNIRRYRLFLLLFLFDRSWYDLIWPNLQGADKVVSGKKNRLLWGSDKYDCFPHVCTSASRAVKEAKKREQRPRHGFLSLGMLPRTWVSVVNCYLLWHGMLLHLILWVVCWFGPFMENNSCCIVSS